jgi:hypothetical protein
MEKNQNIQMTSCISPEINYKKYSDFSPIDLFELFVDEEILEHLRSEITKYALFKNETDPKVTINELKVFITILFLSGYNVMPSKKDYWDSAGDLGNPYIIYAM